MQERDRVIRDLEEKVAFLEAEVRNVRQRLNLTPNEQISVAFFCHIGVYRMLKQNVYNSCISISHAGF